MPRLSPLWIMLACVAGTSSPASSAIAAPAIWRCANSYSDTPCDGGRPIGPAAAPTAEQRRQADEGTRRDQTAADRMERERIRLDAQPRHGVVMTAPGHAVVDATSSAAKLKPDKKKKAQRPQKPEAFTASYSNPADTPAGSRKKTSRRSD
jgi:hypothetical protein